jgi:putative inorganic carbon (HCO3(-)) transporter
MSRKSKKKAALKAAIPESKPGAPPDKIHDFADNLIFSGTLLVLFLRPFLSGRTYPVYNHFFNMAVVVLACLWLIKSWRKGVLELHDRLLTAFLFGFVLICALTFFTTVNKGITFRYIFEILTYFLLFSIIANNFRESSHIKAFIVTILAAGLIVNIYGIFQNYVTLQMTREYVEQALQSADKNSLGGVQIGTGVLNRLENPRIFATFLHPNSYALYLDLIGALTIGFLWTMGRHFQEKSLLLQLLLRLIPKGIRNAAFERYPNFAEKRRFSSASLLIDTSLVLLLLSLGLIMWCLWLTYSRGGLLSAAAVILVFVFAKVWMRKTSRRTMEVTAIVILLCIHMFASTNAFSADKITVKDISFFSRLKDSYTVKQRLSYWKTTMEMVEDKPWSGVGWGAYESAYPRYMVRGGYPVKLAHNNYLQVWAETGIVGLNLFVGIWLVFLYTFWRKARSTVSGEMRGITFGLGAAIIAFLVNSLIDFALYLPSVIWHVFALLGLLAAIPSDYGEKDKFSIRLKAPAGITLLVLLIGFITFLYRSYAALAIYEQIEKERNVAFPNAFSQQRGFKNDPELQYRVVKNSVPRLKQSISYFPQDADSYQLLGDSYLKLAVAEQDPDLLPEAIKSLKRAAELDTLSPYVQHLLAVVYWTQGSTTKQLESYQNALAAEERASENFPVNPMFHEKLEEIYTALGQPEKAKKEAAIAADLAKDYHEF